MRLPSDILRLQINKAWPSGGTGIHRGFKIPRSQDYAGSNPASATIYEGIMPQGKVKGKSVTRSAFHKDKFFLTIEREDGTFFHKQVSRSTYSKKKLGMPWTYFERKAK